MFRAPRLAQVRQHWSLVGALLGPRLSWLSARDGDVKFFGEQFDGAAGLETSCWRDSYRRPSCSSVVGSR